MPLPLVGARISAAAKSTLQRRADDAGVTLATYAAAVLTRHLTEPPLADVLPRPSGLVAATDATRAEVSRRGVAARDKKKIAAPRRRE
jgi:hypothetical protein